MTSIRKKITRWFYGSCPGFAGSFPYFGSKVYFPKNSWSFLAANEQGIFEADNVRIIQALARPNAVYFDVGANIGLMALPVLQREPQCRVVSFEPSPNVLPFLRQTITECKDRDRWTLIPKAVSSKSGNVTFSISNQAESLFDGIQPTQRVATVGQVEVDMTTLDDTWRELSCPSISHMKIDVEGGELDVLRGARECIRNERPTILLEWNTENLSAYESSPSLLIDFAQEMNFQILAVPTLAEVHTAPQLALQMLFTENFILCPI